ncbi:MAG: ABC transporter permease [Rhodospirillaceae bacterium]|nr:ABC transporter permease [Rhodospirillaceae bacterium]
MTETSASSSRDRPPAWFDLEDDNRLRVGGVWRLAQVDRLSRRLERAGLAGRTVREVDASGLTELDSAGAQLLIRTAASPDAIAGVDRRFRGLLRRVADAEAATADLSRTRRPGGAGAQLALIGWRTVGVGLRVWELLGFLGQCTGAVAKVSVRPWTLDGRATLHHLQATGLNALPIVGLLAFLIGVVVAFMGALQLQKFSAGIYTVDMVGVAVLRELGVLFAAIMRVIGLDPVRMLVVPRIVALVIALPLLTVYADLVALAGGAVVSLALLDIGIPLFLERLSNAVDETAFLIGLAKAPFFAAAIAIIGCFEGFKVTGSAASVGRRTTTSVVEAIFTVILIDAAFAMALSWLNI